MKKLTLLCLAVVLFGPGFCRVPPKCAKGSVDFEPPIIVGTIFNTVGGTVYNNGHLLVAKLGRLKLPSGAFSFNQSKVLAVPPFPFGSGQKLRMNNTTLNFDFTSRGIIVLSVTEGTFEYLDQGGVVNIGANGLASLYIGNIRAMPPGLVISGVTFNKISSSPILNAQGTTVGEKGTISFKSPTAIKTIIIGGQELFLDNFCFN